MSERRRAWRLSAVLALALAGALPARPALAPPQEAPPSAAAAAGAAPAPRPRHPSDLRFEPLRYRPPAPAPSELANGLRVWILEDRSLPLVEGVLVIQAGSVDDPPGAAGLAEAVGAAVRTGGTLTRPAEEVDESIDFMGAEVGVEVDDELTTVRFSGLSRDLDRLLALVSDLVRNPAFRKDRLDLARAQMREEIRRRWEDPQDILSLRLADLVYGPRSRWARRTSERSIDQIGQSASRAFHSERYVPSRAWLGLAGDLDPRDGKRKVEKLFGVWRGRPAPPRSHEEPGEDAAAPGVYWIERDLAQAGVAVGHLGAPRLGPDHHALRVLNLIVGGGFSSRLFKEVRTARGLAYGVGGGVGEGYDRGMFRVTLNTQPPRTAEALDVVKQVLAGIRERAPGKEEMRVARDRETHAFVFHFSSPAAIVGERVLRSALGYPLDYLDTYLERIRAVGPEEVRRVAAAYIRPERFVTLIVGPEAGAAPLRSAGMEVRPLALDPAASP